MKTKIIIAALVALAFFPIVSSAQSDEHAPGIYTLVGEEYIPLTYIYGSEAPGVTVVGVGRQKYNYKGVSSEVNASDTFILVIDPNKKTGVISAKKFDYFWKGMNPEDMLVLPLITNQKKNRREYDAGITIGVGSGSVSGGINLENKERATIEWEQITDNSFKIKVPNLEPGEYGFIFRIAKASSFMYESLFGFTIQ